MGINDKVSVSYEKCYTDDVAKHIPHLFGKIDFDSISVRNLWPGSVDAFYKFNCTNYITCLEGDARIIIAFDKGNNNYNFSQYYISGLDGKTIVIEESLMVPATALCACGTAFFLRAIRAASQGGIEIGFHAADALFMAAQTAKGSAEMLLEKGKHPENEVDKVTTPMGCTISGLNQMEHNGFSSSLIKGIVTSAEKAGTLYANNDQ